MELDSHSLLPIWPQLYCLLRSGCSEAELNMFADDILRYVRENGNDLKIWWCCWE